MNRPLSLPAACLALAFLLTACGDRDAAGDAAGTPAAADPAPAAAADAPDPAAAAPLDVASIDAVVRGIARENAMLEAAAERLAGAEGDAAKLAVMNEVQPAALEAAGADAAGLAGADYRRLKDALFTVVGMVEMRAMMEQQIAAIDTAGLDADAAAQAKQNAEAMTAQLSDPFEGLDAATADAIRARQAELATLRATHIGLLFKAAGG